MEKKYCDIEAEHAMAAEAIAPYTVPRGYHAPSENMREHVIASTVSVDEYFDELVSLVRKDYATL